MLEQKWERVLTPKKGALKWLPKEGFAPNGKFVCYQYSLQEAVLSVLEVNKGKYAEMYNEPEDYIFYRRKIPNEKEKLKIISDIDCLPIIIKLKENYYTITRLTDGENEIYEVDINSNNKFPLR